MAEKPRKLVDFKKAWVNGGTNVIVTLLRIRTSVSVAPDRPASYGNQIVSSTRPIAATFVDGHAVGVINIAADHQMFISLTGERS